MSNSEHQIALGAGAALVLTLLSAMPLFAQKQPPTPAVKNIILVHGAFADGTSWSKLIPILEAKGYHVVSVQNPLTSLADDVAATKRAIALQDGPVILVAHSWGGAVITQAGDDPRWPVLSSLQPMHPMPGSRRTKPVRRSASPKGKRASV